MVKSLLIALSLAFGLISAPDDPPTDQPPQVGVRKAVGIEPRLVNRKKGVADEILHVSRSARASDDNRGTRRRPFETIGKAMSVALQNEARGVATEVVIHRGVYRESVTIASEQESTGAGIVIRGKNATLSGSDVWREWRSLGDADVYVHDWPNDWGLAPLPERWADSHAGDHLRQNPVIRRREMIFANGTSLTQVMSLEELGETAGAFYVSDAKDEVYLRLPGGMSLSDAHIEVAVRPNLLSISGMTNVTVDGLIFKHANSSIHGKAVSVSHSNDVSIIDSHFLWNNWAGLGIYRSQRVFIRDSTANHNGIAGITGTEPRDLLLEDTETSYNNWRGSRGWSSETNPRVVDPSFIDWAAGQKFFGVRGATFRRHKSVGNLASGLWFDYDNSNVVLNSVILQDNMTQGIFIEANQGPIAVRNSRICGNETGILINNSRDGELTGNVIAGNEIAQIFIGGDPNAPRPVVDHETGQTRQLLSGAWSLRLNIVAGGENQRAFGTQLNSSSWDVFRNSLDSNLNVWRNPTTDRIFQVPDEGLLNLEEWKAHTEQDSASTSGAASVDCDLLP